MTLTSPNYELIDAADMKVLSDGGIHIIFINDHRDVFYPVLSLNIQNIGFKNSQ